MSRKACLAAFSAAVLASPALGQGASAHINHWPPAGRDYVRIEDWARTADLRVRWVERDKEIELSNNQTRLLFTTDPHQESRKAEINGINLWLAWPLLAEAGHYAISRSDIEETLNPILFPSTNSAGSKVKTICLDPGHGGKDPGFVVGSYQEKKFTLLLAREVRDQLQHEGFKVILTRSTDTFVDLDSRPEIARKSRADLFVSLHFNAVDANRDSVQGVQVFGCTPAGATSSNTGGEGDTKWVDGNRQNAKNILLAYQMQNAFLKTLSIEDRGVKRARYAVLREATMPAILIEGGFLSHPVEGKKIADAGYRRQMAHAIVQGILAYRRIVRG